MFFKFLDRKFLCHRSHQGSALILGAIIILAFIGFFIVVAGIGLYATLTGPGSGGTQVAGGLYETIPEPYRTIFVTSGNKWKVQPAFLAAIFYAGEHGNSWPAFEEHAALGSSLNPSPHHCANPVGCIRGPMQIGEKNWPNWSKGAYGNPLPPERIEWTRDSIDVAAWQLAMLGAGGNTTDESKLKEAAVHYFGVSPYGYEVYAPSVLKAFYKFYNSNAVAGSIVEQAKKYAGIPYSQAVHCGPNTVGPSGVTAVDCSGFVSRVYRDLKLFQPGTCYDTLGLTTSSNLQEISAPEVRAGDLVISDIHGGHKGDQAHVVIYVSGDVTKQFDTWQSGGDPNNSNVREALRNARPGQRYFHAKRLIK